MRIKILINQILIALISSLLIGGLIYILVEINYTKLKTDNLKSNEVLISSIIDNELENNTNLNYYSLTQTLSDKLGYRITIFNNNGKPIADSINNSIILKSDYFDSSFNITKNDYLVQKTFSPELGFSYFYLFLPRILVDNEYISIRIGEPYGIIDYFVGNFFSYIIFSIILGTIISIIISFITSKRLTKPLKELESAALEINRGNLGAKVSMKSSGEIENLANAFNQMSSKLEFLIDDLKAQNIQKDSILTSIEDGIIAIDNEGHLLFMNNSLYKILDIQKEDLSNYSDFDEISKNIFINSITFEDIKEQGFEKEIKYVNGKTIHISTHTIEALDKIGSSLGYLITVRDMTELRNYEDLRKSFVGNISHELRTPLTSISGFLEIMEKKNLTEEMKQKSFDIVKVELKRLYDLIDKMLLLSKVEEINWFFEDKINFYEIFSDTKKLLNIQAKNKNIKMRIFFNKKIEDYYSDKELIKLIFINLIENAITYGKEDCLIQIKVLDLADYISISVKDYGVGIPKDELPFIFERFYRSPHSRHMGNKQTGLGLSIVKSIVDALDGNISIDSELNKFTEVKIILNKQKI